jgi:acyl-ACP thioesterase
MYNQLKEGMKSMFYDKKVYIPTEYCDYTIRLGYCQSFFLLQNAMIDGFEVYDCGNKGLGERCNAYWAVTKTKLHINKRAFWGETVDVKSDYINDGKLRVNVKTKAYDKNGELLLSGAQELCVLDKESHRVKRLSDTCLPEPEKQEPVAEFEKFKIPENSCASYELTVRSQHIDMSRHVNNIEYIRMALDLFSVDELINDDISDIEVHYIGECREGETLCCQRFDENNESYVTISKEDKKCFEMKIIRR